MKYEVPPLGVKLGLGVPPEETFVAPFSQSAVTESNALGLGVISPHQDFNMKLALLRLRGVTTFQKSKI